MHCIHCNYYIFKKNILAVNICVYRYVYIYILCIQPGFDWTWGVPPNFKGRIHWPVHGRYFSKIHSDCGKLWCRKPHQNELPYLHMSSCLFEIFHSKIINGTLRHFPEIGQKRRPWQKNQRVVQICLTGKWPPTERTSSAKDCTYN